MSSKLVRRPYRTRPRSAHARRWTSRFEGLETRSLLSNLPVAEPMYQLGSMASSSPISGAYSPSQIATAYAFNNLSFNGVAGNGAGETIAIVDAYSDPNIQTDLNTFDTQFGLPATTITQVNENGGTSLPGPDTSGGWGMETSLDVEWAHAMAPGAKILLVEANSSNESDLLAGVSYAAQNANVVSMSWGGGEFSGETSYDSTFSVPGVAFVASSGDAGAPVSWPAASPNVLAVGGTALTLNANGSYGSETGWSGSGGGISAYESMPSYQASANTGASNRSNPDVAYNASPNTGFAVYDSYQNGGWTQVGGTSAGAPQWAAILAIADQGRALAGLPALNSTNAQEVMTELYQAQATDFHDITSGTSTGSPNYTATAGYDFVTGLGTPIVANVVNTLDGGVTALPDTITVSAPSSATAGQSLNFTVTADSPTGGVDTGFTGTITFSSTDANAGLPGSYTFTSADQGTHTFNVTFQTAGSQSITASGSGLSATSSGISVAPAAPTNLGATAASSSGINLSWTAAAGATGYEIERSTGGGAWAQVGTTTATTYQDTGLAAGTGYSYQVIATGGGLSSAASNVATATTISAASAPTTTDSLWSGLTTPPENAYAWGSYELGLQFSSTTGGVVTGVRFYKQTWMSGPNVGTLWSSTGQVLASAAFTGESSFGWQQVTFSNPVTIQPNTTYVVSFSTSSSYFGITTGYFNGQTVSNGPLQAPSNGVIGSNGVYQSAGYFPNIGSGGMNFWVDLNFSPSTAASLQTAPATAAPAVKTLWGSFATSQTATGTTHGTQATTGDSVATAAVVSTSRRVVNQPQHTSTWGASRRWFRD